MDGTPYSIFDPGSELALVLREQAREIHDLLARREIWRSSILVDEHSGFRFGQLVMATDAQDSVFGRKRTFNLALHFFTVDENSATRSSIHDHRYPFAIHPCGPPSST
ncbi:MAG: hypothetical protein KDK06_07300, partial [Gammaproteobacteria bacterium]|nr:hypothetical protein [Gammaproteobacteria bacterium]